MSYRTQRRTLCTHNLSWHTPRCRCFFSGPSSQLNNFGILMRFLAMYFQLSPSHNAKHFKWSFPARHSCWCTPSYKQEQHYFHSWLNIIFGYTVKPPNRRAAILSLLTIWQGQVTTWFVDSLQQWDGRIVATLLETKSVGTEGSTNSSPPAHVC